MSTKIIMVAPTPFFADRGCHIRVLNSYLRLQKDGYDILLLTYPLGRDIKGVNTKRVLSLPGYRKMDPGFSVYKPILDFFLLVSLIKYYLKLHPSVLYCHLHEGGLAGVIVKKIFRHVKVVFDSQGSLSGELVSNGTVKKSRIVNVLDWVEKFILKNTNTIITSTEGLKKRYEKIVPESKLKVVIDYPDRDLFNPHIKPVDPSILSLPDKQIVVYLGGLRRNKGIEYLLQSILFTSEDIHFLLMGYPLEEVRLRIQELGITDRITLIGPIPYEEAASYLKVADVAVSPKVLSESGEANAKLYIYNAIGLPVVCFDTPENRRILNNKGFFAREKDPKDIARQIELACNVPLSSGT